MKFFRLMSLLTGVVIGSVRADIMYFEAKCELTSDQWLTIPAGSDTALKTFDQFRAYAQAEGEKKLRADIRFYFMPSDAIAVVIGLNDGTSYADKFYAESNEAGYLDSDWYFGRREGRYAHNHLSWSINSPQITAKLTKSSTDETTWGGFFLTQWSERNADLGVRLFSLKCDVPANDMFRDIAKIASK